VSSSDSLGGWRLERLDAGLAVSVPVGRAGGASNFQPELQLEVPIRSKLTMSPRSIRMVGFGLVC